jgi:hypothetical protein
MYHHDGGSSPPSDTHHLALTCGFASCTPTETSKTAGQQPGVVDGAPWWLKIRSAGLLRCEGPGWMVLVFAAADPGNSVVPVSLQVSMVAEGFHGNRGLVP